MKKMTPPEPSPDPGQQFTIKAPGARAVLLAADFTRWQEQALPMKPMADAVWGVSVALPPGTYQYRFLVDGEWYNDPECTRRAPTIYGSENMVREVPPTPPPATLLPGRNRGRGLGARKSRSAARSKTVKPQPIRL